MISSIVRKQPVHNPVCACITQTPIHGVGNGPLWVRGSNGGRISTTGLVLRPPLFFFELGVEFFCDDDRALMLALADLVVTIPSFDLKA
jgi:hypothetical protein